MVVVWPMILQAVFIFFGLPYFTDNQMQFSNIWTVSVLVVSINTGAYMAESVRGGILSIDPGQTEGAKAIGMNEVGLNANWLRQDLTHKETQEFAKTVLNHMAGRHQGKIAAPETAKR